MQEILSNSSEETRAAGREMAKRLQPGNVVLLEGDLGAGKTTFVQAIAEGLGAEVPATSPSFVIVNEYPISGIGGGAPSIAASSQGPTPDARRPRILRHIDLYRLPDPLVDMNRIGLPELLTDKNAITLIEWADRLPQEARVLLQKPIEVKISHGKDESSRIISFTS